MLPFICCKMPQDLLQCWIQKGIGRLTSHMLNEINIISVSFELLLQKQVKSFWECWSVGGAYPRCCGFSSNLHTVPRGSYHPAAAEMTGLIVLATIKTKHSSHECAGELQKDPSLPLKTIVSKFLFLFQEVEWEHLSWDTQEKTLLITTLSIFKNLYSLALSTLRSWWRPLPKPPLLFSNRRLHLKNAENMT